MRILYHQAATPLQSSTLQTWGIQNCYCKALSMTRDTGQVTRKTHHHNGYEVHILCSGSQRYETGGREWIVSAGSFFLIPPGIPHRICASSPDTEKYSLSFRLAESSPLHLCGMSDLQCILEKTPAQLRRCTDAILAERNTSSSLTATLVSNHVFEMIVALFRTCGLSEPTGPFDQPVQNARLLLAKQFIQDNLRTAPGVSDVAAYCHLSTRQLSRVFLSGEGCTPAAYIARQRCQLIESLLEENSLSLREISEQLLFSSEYYFNTFFKRYAGMTPGFYAKMHQNTR